MYRAGGGTSIYARDPAQRRLRDVYTAAQHAMVSPAILEVAGRTCSACGWTRRRSMRLRR